MLGELFRMSVVEVEVDARWGVYQGCNFGLCSRELWKLPFTPIDPSLPAVGRMTIGSLAATTGDADYTTQCDGAKGMGTWFHLPRSGKCVAGASPADGSCTWQQIKVVKTINTVTCFLQNARLRALTKEWLEIWSKFAGPPYGMSAAINAAFASDDPALGGCPPV